MSHNSATVRPSLRILNKRGADVLLQTLLRREVEPMNLRKMHLSCLMCSQEQSSFSAETMLQYMQQLTARVAKCYQMFTLSSVQRVLQHSHYEHLRSLRSITQKDLEYCIVLEWIAQKRLETTRHNRSNPLQELSSCSPLSPYESQLSTSLNEEQERQEQQVLGWQLSHCPDKLDKMFDRKDAVLLELPFEHSLQILRPHYSLLDMIVDDGCAYTNEMNEWLTQFCTLRLCWRLWHEHIMHISSSNTWLSRNGCLQCNQQNVNTIIGLDNNNINNNESITLFPPVVSVYDNIVDLLKSSATAVAELYSSLFDEKSGYTLTIHVEEDRSILSKVPKGELLGCHTEEQNQLQQRQQQELELEQESTCTTQNVEDRIYLIKDNIMYILREVIKNACLATCKVRRNIKVQIKYAVTETHVAIDIIDRAGGIPLDHAQDIWRFGWTTNMHYKASLGGQGIGLPMSRVYMRLWGGSMNVYSDKGNGTTVRLSLPRMPIEQS